MCQDICRAIGTIVSIAVGVILPYSPGPKGWSALTSGVLRKTTDGAIAYPATRTPCVALDFAPLAALSTNE